nr:hypothetical protein Iba_chr06bCG11660 [Ipomoea batatas]
MQFIEEGSRRLEVQDELDLGEKEVVTLLGGTWWVSSSIGPSKILDREVLLRSRWSWEMFVWKVDAVV